MKYSNREEFDKSNAFGQGNSNDAYAQYFAGNSFFESFAGVWQGAAVSGKLNL